MLGEFEIALAFGFLFERKFDDEIQIGEFVRVGFRAERRNTRLLAINSDNAVAIRRQIPFP